MKLKNNILSFISVGEFEFNLSTGQYQYQPTNRSKVKIISKTPIAKFTN